MKTSRYQSYAALGNIIEWYDFTLYVAFIPIFSQLYFSQVDPATGIIIGYAVFAISYLARPIGSYFFGKMGDKLGRKATLLLTIGLMTLTMLSIGYLPTATHWGNSAAILLILLRLIQGIAAGGEVTGTFVYMLESCTKEKRGFFGALTWSFVSIGILLGSLTIMLVQSMLSPMHFMLEGWRLCYFIGVALGFLFFFIRLSMPESIDYSQLKKRQNEQVKQKASMQQIIMLIGLMATPASLFYFTFFYLPQYTQQYSNTNWPYIHILVAIVQLLGIGMMLFFGQLSDKYKSYPILLTSSILSLILPFGLLFVMNDNAHYFMIFCVFVLFTLLTMSYQGPLPSLMIKCTHIETRYFTTAMGFNIGFAIFGGLAPLISQLLIIQTGSLLSPAVYLLICSLITLATLFYYRNTIKNNEK
ncbi:MFS transporter [Shewanella surugensis]|uniref:MFS transporter n=1 Tax=Shewanella surugensis TaxID=212020 RepID=A0ABT0LCB7_9GAMM|nr:MFS transporter [Shewanella surugensis]MCL1125333.1 MFS transporter [Shewanella surugensis]